MCDRSNLRTFSIKSFVLQFGDNYVKVYNGLAILLLKSCKGLLIIPTISHFIYVPMRVKFQLRLIIISKCPVKMNSKKANYKE